MIDHLSTYAVDFAATRGFYEVVLKALGYSVQMEYPGACAFGPPGRPVFWVMQSETPATPRHIAFSAADREMVTHFYHAGLKHGAADNGPPGLRPQYHEHYYGAFLYDPDGNNVEAVCHAAEMPD